MKKNYLTLTFIISVLFLNAQSYEFGLSFIGTNPSTGNYQIALIATPDFNQSTPASTSDMGAAVYLPSDCSIGNFVAGDIGMNFEWSAIQEASYDGGTTDLIQLYRQDFVPNSITHNASQAITVVMFDVIPEIGGNPTSGELVFGADYTDIPTGNTYESFMNVDITGGNTQNYFSNFDPAANSINFGTLSVDNPSFESLKVSVHPNPTSDILNIETNKDLTFSIFNILGQSVKLNGSISNNTSKSVNLSHLPDGVYILKVNDENKNSKSYKIIKKQ